MRAAIGADDLELFQEPFPELLSAVTGLEPEPSGLHVILDPYGVRSTQRLALSRFAGGVVVALWPGELKVQAEYLYGNRLGNRMVDAARVRGWSAEGSVQLAFRNSAPSQRLYMKPGVDASVYARRWEEGDLVEVGAHDRDDVQRRLWPWLKERDYADDDDDAELRRWLDERLGRRPALLRPGLRLKGRWQGAGSHDELAESIRADVNAVLASANEPLLTGRRRV